LAVSNQREHRGGTYPTPIGAGEQPRAVAYCNSAQSALGGVSRLQRNTRLREPMATTNIAKVHVVSKLRYMGRGIRAHGPRRRSEIGAKATAATHRRMASSPPRRRAGFDRRQDPAIRWMA
jgi:hypothetical protein